MLNQKITYLGTLFNSIATVIVKCNVKIDSPLSVKWIGWTIPLQNVSSKMHILKKIFRPVVSLVIEACSIACVFAALTCNTLGTTSRASCWRIWRTIVETFQLLWIVVSRSSQEGKPVSIVNIYGCHNHCNCYDHNSNPDTIQMSHTIATHT